MTSLAQGGCGHPPLQIVALFRGDFFQFVNHCAVFGSTADTADIIGIEEAGGVVDFYIATLGTQIGMGVIAMGPVCKGTCNTRLRLVSADTAYCIVFMILGTVSAIGVNKTTTLRFVIFTQVTCSPVLIGVCVCDHRATILGSPVPTFGAAYGVGLTVLRSVVQLAGLAGNVIITIFTRNTVSSVCKIGVFRSTTCCFDITTDACSRMCSIAI